MVDSSVPEVGNGARGKYGGGLLCCGHPSLGAGVEPCPSSEHVLEQTPKFALDCHGWE